MNTRTALTLSVPRQRRTLVLGHRGAPGPQRGENSVRAVEAALERGADGVEVDVRLSSDGVLVCSHDPVVETALGERLHVASHTWGELHRAAARAGDRLANLEQVLAAAGRRGPCHLVVEAKPAAGHAAASATVGAIHEALRGVPTSVTVTVSSFDWRLLDLVRGSGSRVRTAVLGGTHAPAHVVLRQALDAGHQEAHLGLAALRRAPHAVRLARHLGVAVTAWTVNGLDDLRRVAEWGVDGVITDNVVLARTALREAEAAAPLQLTAC
jgi:glycerophosphoryl diester phosphodiesterase